MCLCLKNKIKFKNEDGITYKNSGLAITSVDSKFALKSWIVKEGNDFN